MDDSRGNVISFSFCPIAPDTAPSKLWRSASVTSLDSAINTS